MVAKQVGQGHTAGQPQGRPGQASAVPRAHRGAHRGAGAEGYWPALAAGTSHPLPTCWERGRVSQAGVSADTRPALQCSQGLRCDEPGIPWGQVPATAHPVRLPASDLGKQGRMGEVQPCLAHCHHMQCEPERGRVLSLFPKLNFKLKR